MIEADISIGKTKQRLKIRSDPLAAENILSEKDFGKLHPRPKLKLTPLKAFIDNIIGEFRTYVENQNNTCVEIFYVKIGAESSILSWDVAKNLSLVAERAPLVIKPKQTKEGLRELEELDCISTEIETTKERISDDGDDLKELEELDCISTEIETTKEPGADDEDDLEVGHPLLKEPPIAIDCDLTEMKSAPEFEPSKPLDQPSKPLDQFPITPDQPPKTLDRPPKTLDCVRTRVKPTVFDPTPGDEKERPGRVILQKARKLTKTSRPCKQVLSTTRKLRLEKPKIGKKRAENYTLRRVREENITCMNSHTRLFVHDAWRFKKKKRNALVKVNTSTISDGLENEHYRFIPP